MLQKHLHISNTFFSGSSRSSGSTDNLICMQLRMLGRCGDSNQLAH